MLAPLLLFWKSSQFGLHMSIGLDAHDMKDSPGSLSGTVQVVSVVMSNCNSLCLRNAEFRRNHPLCDRYKDLPAIDPRAKPPVLGGRPVVRRGQRIIFKALSLVVVPFFCFPSFFCFKKKRRNGIKLVTSISGMTSWTAGKWSSCNLNDFSRVWSSWWRWRVDNFSEDSRERNLCRFTCLCSCGWVWIACLRIEEHSGNNWLHCSLLDEEHCNFFWLYHSCQSIRLRTWEKTFVCFSPFRFKV